MTSATVGVPGHPGHWSRGVAGGLDWRGPGPGGVVTGVRPLRTGRPDVPDPEEFPP